MSQFPDKAYEPVPDLPNPELNPLLNPVLGRHLGQWAHVYFTTAPEKREVALYELLEGLKAEEARNGIPSAAAEEEADGAAAEYASVCPHCQRSNVRSQRFCGMCGSPMPVRAQAAAAATGGNLFGEALFSPAFDEPAVQETTSPTVPRTFTPASEPAFEHVSMNLGPTSLLFQSPAEESAAGDTEPPHKPVDIDWLRERNSPTPRESGAGLRTAVYVMACAVLICGAGAIYLHLRAVSAREAIADTQEPAAATAQPHGSPTVLPEEPAPSAPTPRNSSPVADGEPRTNQPDPTSARRNPEVATGNSASSPRAAATAAPKAPPRVPAQSTTPAAADPTQNGGIELATAKQYLSGPPGQVDGAAAAKLLWKAIAKQNTAALLLLSDLYATGNGVPKSCDQARLLVDAALRKNVPTADLKLRELQKTCP